jgi:PRTRC genetic system protein A
MNPVGYLLNTRAGLTGEQGLFYDYILAGNGLLIQAQCPLLVARVNIAAVGVRGLAPVGEKVELTHGRIPMRLYNLAVSIMAADRERERYLAVTWEGEYRLREPWQDRGGGHVTYEVLPNTVLDIHSHGIGHAFSSETDNRDEQGLKLYAVVGRVDTLLPEVEIRIGIYGYFAPVQFEEVFLS